VARKRVVKNIHSEGFIASEGGLEGRGGVCGEGAGQGLYIKDGSPLSVSGRSEWEGRGKDELYRWRGGMRRFRLDHPSSWNRKGGVARRRGESEPS